MSSAITALLICHLMAPPLASEHVLKTCDEKSITVRHDDQEQVVKYRLLTPLKVEPGKKYPVILFLHGAGERGDDNQKQLIYLPEQMAKPEYREKYPCFLIAPQCPLNERWIISSGGYSSKTSVEVLGKQMRLENAGMQMQNVVAMLDEVLKLGAADPRRVYLTGLSMGGYGSWDLAMRLPERFAAVVPICGGGDERYADRLVSVPIWAWHGDADDAVPVERSRNMIEAIKKAGGSPKYAELKGVGHNSWNQAYGNPDGAIPWMFEQKMR